MLEQKRIFHLFKENQPTHYKLLSHQISGMVWNEATLLTLEFISFLMTRFQMTCSCIMWNLVSTSSTCQHLMNCLMVFQCFCAIKYFSSLGAVMSCLLMDLFMIRQLSWNRNRKLPWLLIQTLERTKIFSAISSF